MPVAENNFKRAIAVKRPQIGLWVALADSYAAGIVAGAGFDWLLIDGEHGPNDLRSILAQLSVIGRNGSHAVVRLPTDETWMIKQVLDIGAQTLLIPMVESGDQAAAIVRATRYPPRGVRGVGAGLARASDFNRVGDYLTTAEQELCLLLQIETLKGIDALDAILRCDGVDGVFVGPSDLAADMGYLGKPSVPEVQAVVEETIARIVRSGKPAGILTADLDLARRYLDLGASFVAVGSDIALLARGAENLAHRFKNPAR